MYIPANVMSYARRLGLSDGKESSLAEVMNEMVSKSAPITHPSGNRRFEDWIFLVSNNRINRVHLIECSACEDRKRIEVGNVCIDCDGDGCEKCGFHGEIAGVIPCAECAII